MKVTLSGKEFTLRCDMRALANAKRESGLDISKLKDDVPDKVKQERLQEAMRVVEEVARRKNEALVGSNQEILVDLKQNNRYSGRTRTNKIVKFLSEKNDLLGKLVSVRIKSSQSWVLEGEINGKR